MPYQDLTMVTTYLHNIEFTKKIEGHNFIKHKILRLDFTKVSYFSLSQTIENITHIMNTRQLPRYVDFL